MLDYKNFVRMVAKVSFKVLAWYLFSARKREICMLVCFISYGLTNIKKKEKKNYNMKIKYNKKAGEKNQQKKHTWIIQ